MRFQPCALHEAGHAVVAERLGLRVDRIEILNAFSGAVEVDVSESDHERQAMVALAGLAAVEMFDGPVDHMTEDQETDDCDMPTARRHATALAGPDGDADAVLAALRKRTDELLSLPGTESLLHAIADRAIRCRGLDGDAIRGLMTGAGYRNV